MLQRVTDAIISVEGEALRQGVQVVIEERFPNGRSRTSRYRGNRTGTLHRTRAIVHSVTALMKI